jgi:hypothetical protein
MRHLSGRDVYPLRWALAAWLALAALPARGAEPAVEGQWGPLMMWPGPATHAHLLPTGKVLFFPEQEYGDNPRTWDPSTGAWSWGPYTAAGSRPYGSAVLYDEGRVLIVGGGDPPKATAEVIDVRAPTPTWRATGSLHRPRRQANATLLPDGTVLVTGGSSGAGFDNRDAPVKEAELWDPATGQWTVLAYDDAAWKSGPAQLGYGDGDERTRLTRRASGAQPSVYFRKTLRLDRAVTAASLQVLFDDAFAVWVNGRLVLSRNVGNGTGYAAWASASSGDNAVVSAPVPLSPNPFVVGPNVIAVIVKQTEAASSDTSFDLELKLEGAP